MARPARTATFRRGANSSSWARGPAPAANLQGSPIPVGPVQVGGDIDWPDDLREPPRRKLEEWTLRAQLARAVTDDPATLLIGVGILVTILIAGGLLLAVLA